jgi:regulator of replication initiation timing
VDPPHQKPSQPNLLLKLQNNKLRRKIKKLPRRKSHHHQRKKKKMEVWEVSLIEIFKLYNTHFSINI